MADRSNHLPVYPMPPNNFMNLAAAQQQSTMAYQQPRTSMNPAQQIPGVTNPDHQRMWQHIQDSHRAQMGGADSMGSQQVNQNMAELLRSHAAHAQAQNHQQQQQQSPPQLQQAHQFPNLGGLAQMNGIPNQNALAAMQQRQQGGGIGALPNAPHMAQMLAAQRNGGANPAMLQMNRQLGLLNRAQKQQPQNGPANFGHTGPPFGGQQNLGSLPFQPGMFPQKQDDGRPTVAQGQQQFPTATGLSNGLLSGQPFPNELVQQVLRNGDGRQLTHDEVRFKVLQLKRTIETERATLAGVPNPTSPEAVAALREKHRELQQKELIFNRMAEHLRGLTNQPGLSQPQQPGPSNAVDGQNQGTLNSTGYPNPSSHQAGQQLVQNQNWMAHVNNGGLPNQLAGNGLLSNQQMLNGGSQNGHIQAPHQQLSSPFHPNLVQSQQQQTPVPRSGPTPQQQHMLQQFLQQNGSHPSPSSSGSAPPSGQANMVQQVSALNGKDVQHRPNGINFPPLTRERFFAMIQEWWKRNKINLDPRLIQLGNRQIDIHQLHTEVLQYGGVVNVKRHDLWNVIAAKMGWTAANLSEIGRTQEQIAEQFKIVYEQLLETFELTYMAAAMKQSLTAQPPQQTTDQQSQSGGPSQPTGPISQAATQQAMQMMRLATLSAEQLRAAHYSENVIQHIEQNRTSLLATWRRIQLQRMQNASQQQQFMSQQQAPSQQPGVQFQNQPQNPQATHSNSALQGQASMPIAGALSHPGLAGGPGQANDAPAQQRPQYMNTQMINILSNLQKPTQEAIQLTAKGIEQLRQEISKTRNVVQERNLSDAEKGIFPAQFEALCNILRDVMRFLTMYHASTSDVQIVRGLLGMYDLCERQRQFLQAANPVYILDMPMLQKLMKTALEIKSKVLLVMQQLRIMSQGEQSQTRPTMPQQNQPNDAGLPPSSTAQQGPVPQNLASSPASVPPRPPTAPLQSHHPQQNLRVPPSKTPQMTPARPPSVMRQKGQLATSPGAMEGATSPAATPLAAAATPTHVQASPQPKSPKTKAPPKSRTGRQRKLSKVVSVNPSTVATAASPSTTASTVAPAPATASTSTSTIEPAPSPAHTALSPAEKSLKRPREADPPAQSGSTVPPASASGETPSKRIKSEWQSVSDTEPSRRQAEADDIKTPGQAAQFYSDMTQILELSNNSALPPDLQETLAQLVKTVGPGLDIPDGSGGSMSNLTSAGTSSPKIADGDDSFFSFLDFTAFQQDDEKAADTPELVPTSSTNPSPESGAGSEVDHPPAPASSGSVGDRTKIVDTSESEPKVDFLDSGSDPLRLSMWGEVDGGESGYFNTYDNWKWDASTSSGDSSWAIST